MIADQRWLITWTPQQVAPDGTNHGSSGVCLTDRGVVMVSRDAECWELPAGRPEADESLFDTLRREVREEACCEVETARLLGFTVSRCLEGHEQGVVLVRSHWSARVAVEPWQPHHETVERREVARADFLSVLTIEAGLERFYEELWSSARAAGESSVWRQHHR
ncbi:NUDIX hydrolase [Nocardioides rubriscoriae]|uniref:NUDIX hydrolase n=1 Tax=Nocardioides rubriscoriae TaxID=642762 RepID=UPI0011DF957C|nr:NUDIX domain-containing protein [Nocardioides rubriscoriae]